MNKNIQNKETSELMERLLAINERMGKLIFYELMVNAAEELEEGEEEELDESECDDCEDCDDCEESEEYEESEEDDEELESEEDEEDDEHEPATLEEVVDAIETRLEYLESLAGAQFDFEECDEDEGEEE